MYSVKYVKRIGNEWRRGQLRNLSFEQAMKWQAILKEVLDTNFVTFIREDKLQ
jgi:hypothetical protein